MKKLLATLLLSTALLGAAHAQLQFPSPSPQAKLEQKLGLGSVTIEYSRPGLKERKIFGEQVPYGQMWRTGANQSTKITFSEDVTFEGKSVPKGTYSVVSIPGEKSWTIILNKELDLNNLAKYDPKNDIARVEVKPVALPTPVETLTFDIADISDESAKVVMSWGRTAVPIKLNLDTNARVMEQLKTEMPKPGDRKPGEYAYAAVYYLEHGGDLNQALAWIDKAISMNPEAFFWIYRKAQILGKLGRREEAIAEAKRSMEMAQSNPSFKDEYTWRNKQLIESL